MHISIQTISTIFYRYMNKKKRNGIFFKQSTCKYPNISFVYNCTPALYQSEVKLFSYLAFLGLLAFGGVRKKTKIVFKQLQHNLQNLF